MSLLLAKQIGKLLTATVGIAGFATAGGTSDTITTALTTALATAGNGGVSVPLQVGSATQEGVDTAAGFNLAKVFLSASGKTLTDGNGNDVYGKVSVAGAVWSIAYFSAPGGVEAAFAMPAAASIAFDVPYIFSFADLPLRALTAVAERHVGPDLAAYGFRSQGDALTVTAANTLSALSQTAAGTFFLLVVNGLAYTALGSNPPFSVAGTAVTWSAANAGFALMPGDDVKAVYSY